MNRGDFFDAIQRGDPAVYHTARQLESEATANAVERGHNAR